MATKIQLRNDTSSSCSSANPILAQGEPGLETNTSKIKYGNGTSAWNCLPYANGENCGSACGVPEKFYTGLRLAEQLYDADMIKWYVHRLEILEKNSSHLVV
jgi:hypothetical protein